MSQPKRKAEETTRWPSTTKRQRVVLPSWKEEMIECEDRCFRPTTLAALAEHGKEDETPLLNLLAVRSDCDAYRPTFMLDMQWVDAMDQLFFAVHPLPSSTSAPEDDEKKGEAVEPELMHEYEGLPWAGDPRTSFCAAMWALARLGGLEAARALFHGIRWSSRYKSRVLARQGIIHAALDQLAPRLYSARNRMAELTGENAVPFAKYQDELFGDDVDAVQRIHRFEAYIAHMYTTQAKKCASASLAPMLALGLLSTNHPYLPVRIRQSNRAIVGYRWGTISFAYTGVDHQEMSIDARISCDCSTDNLSHENWCASHIPCIATLFCCKCDWCDKEDREQLFLFRPSWAEFRTWFNIKDSKATATLREAPDRASDDQIKRARKWAVRAANKMAAAFKKPNCIEHPQISSEHDWNIVTGPEAWLKKNNGLYDICSSAFRRHHRYVHECVRDKKQMESSDKEALIWPFPRLQDPVNSFFRTCHSGRFYVHEMEHRMRFVAEHLFVVGRNGLAGRMLCYLGIDILANLVAEYLLAEPGTYSLHSAL